MKDKTSDSNYFTINNGGKLLKKTQWYSADKTKRFQTDDKSSAAYIQPSIAPNHYSPRGGFAGKFEVQRFSEMGRNQLNSLLNTIDGKTTVTQ